MVRRRWAALRYFAGDGPAILGRAWTRWGADRLIDRDRRRQESSPAYRYYQWVSSRRDRAAW